jgi:2,3-bisphosphoglycerate-dependent phosphoglycerate mutase
MSGTEDQFTHRITLLRHGESTGNAQGVYQGRAEFDLSEKGRAQARSLGEYWLAHEVTYTQVISSPQARARQTAQIVSEILEIPLLFNDQWQEIDNGVLAGVPLETVLQKHPFPEIMTPFDPIGESGESNWDLYQRAGKVVQALVKKPAGDYLVVSHGGFLNRVLYVILGIVPQVNFSGARFRFGNTSYAVLQYNASRHIWLVDSLNFAPHIFPEN